MTTHDNHDDRDNGHERDDQHRGDDQRADESTLREPTGPLRSPDDPRLTTYALGEADTQTAALVERYLAVSPEARAALDELRTFAGLLGNELRTEHAPGLDPARRAALEQALGDGVDAGSVGNQAAVRDAGPAAAPNGSPAPTRRRSIGRLWWPALAAAALITFLFTSSWDFITRSGHWAEAAPPSAEVLAQLAREEALELEAMKRRLPLALGYLHGGSARSKAASPAPAAQAAPAPSAAGEPFTYDLFGEEAPAGAAGEALPSSQLGVPPAEAWMQPSGSQTTAGSAGAAAAAGPQASGSESVTGRGLKAGGLVAAVDPNASPAIPEQQWLQSLGYVGVAKTATTVDGGEADDARLRESPTSPSAPQPARESYAAIHENPFVPLTGDPLSALSTFGLDVDTASYANVRRFLNRNQLPPADAVRLEELVNNFDYALPQPDDKHPFAVSVESASAPWAPQHRLVRVALTGRQTVEAERPASNLVFLVDVSGSMNSADKLPLLVASLRLLVEQLGGQDRVALVTYANGTRLALPSTPGSERATILAALDGLSAGGSTHASAGIQQAYEVAKQGFLAGGNNRVLLCTDGDFNVGITTEGALEDFITGQAKSGVFLTVLGFGTGNLQDSKAEILADRGNGAYAYIDSLNEAHKVLVRNLGATLQTIAKDVKLQVEFNPGAVAAYRLLGYENRALAAQDFRDDRKDAGEMGAGHTVVAFYEVVPAGLPGLPGTADLKYQSAPPPDADGEVSPELLTVNVRYKLPDEDSGREFAVPFVDGEAGFSDASEDFRFAASVAAFGMILRDSRHRGDVDLERVHAWAAAALGSDPHGDRQEFLRLVRAAQGLVRR